MSSIFPEVMDPVGPQEHNPLLLPTVDAAAYQTDASETRAHTTTESAAVTCTTDLSRRLTRECCREM